MHLISKQLKKQIGFDRGIKEHTTKIHRHQVLTHDLRGRPFGSPVFYAGSTARTSFVERFEPKVYLKMEIVPDASGGRVVSWRSQELSPASDFSGAVVAQPPSAVPSSSATARTAQPGAAVPQQQRQADS